MNNAAVPADPDGVAGRCGMFVPALNAYSWRLTRSTQLVCRARAVGSTGCHGRGPVKASRPALVLAIPTSVEHTNLNGSDV